MAPIIVVSGAMGVGKSTIAKTLVTRQSDKYTIIDGNLCNIVTFPNKISEYRKTWVDICFDIANQTNRAVVFYVDIYPDCFCEIDKTKYKDMYFVSIVCNDEELKARIESKYGDAAHEKIPNIDKSWYDMSMLRNQVYSGHTKYQYPMMDVLDTSGLNIEQSADLLDRYITQILINKS